MIRRLASWLAWTMCALAVALSISIIPLVIAAVNAASVPGTLVPSEAAKGLKLSVLDWIEGVFGIVPLVAFSVLGALIVSRYPAHAIGWIFCAIGLLGATEPFAGYYAIYALFVAPGALPGGLLAGWLQNWIWVVSAALLSAFLPLRFPTGRLLSARWKPAWWLATSATAALALGAAFHPGPLWNGLERFNIPNPFGVPSFGGMALVLSNAPFGLLLASMLVAVASLVVRLRRACGDERRQIKWFGYFGAVLAALFVLQGVVRYILGISTPAFEFAFRLGWPIALTGLPIATGLAILRYHLWDIDLLIRRTLVYGTLTAVVAALYFGVVIGTQALVHPLTGQRGQQPAVIVATTLLIAALFNRLRRGVQAAIDRGFYRRKYDAAKALQALGVTLRGAVELNELSARMLMIVQETMQPAHLSLWLRPPERQPQAWRPELSHLDGLAEGLAPNALRTPLGGEQ